MMFVVIKFEIVVEDLFKGFLVYNVNDVVIVLVECFDGFEVVFVDWMNCFVVDIRMINSWFNNLIGFEKVWSIIMVCD